MSGRLPIASGMCEKCWLRQALKQIEWGLRTSEWVHHAGQRSASRPVGKESRRHAGSTGEVSRHLLANVTRGLRSALVAHHQPHGGPSRWCEVRSCHGERNTMDVTSEKSDDDTVIWPLPEEPTLSPGSTTGHLNIVRATSRFAVEPFRLVARGSKHDGCRETPCASCRCYNALRDTGHLVVTAANLAARMHEHADGAVLDAFMLEYGAQPAVFLDAAERDRRFGAMLRGEQERARPPKPPKTDKVKAPRVKVKKHVGAARALVLAQRQAGSEALAALSKGTADEKTQKVWARFCEDFAADRTLFWPSVYSYPAIRAAVPRLSSHIAATLQSTIAGKWQRERFNTLIRQNRKPFRFREGMPIPLPRQAIRILEGDEVTRGNEKAPYMLSFSLAAGRHEGGAEFRLPLVPDSARQRIELHALATGQWKLGQASLEPDRRKRGRWYLRFSYTRVVERPQIPIKWAAINRGICVFLAALTQDGERLLYDGTDIEGYLKQIQDRRRQYQRAGRVAGRKGHGTDRTLRPIETLEGKARRWRETRCQTLAREFVRWLVKHGITDLIVENFKGIRDAPVESLEGGVYVWQRIQEWPYFQLGSRIRACCDEAGIRVHERDPEYNSQACPACSHTSPDNIDLRWRKLRCANPECSYVEQLDVAYCRNALQRERSGDVPGPGVARKAGRPGKSRRKAVPTS